MADQLVGDVLCGGRMPGQGIEHRESLVLALLTVLNAQNLRLPRLVVVFLEIELACLGMVRGKMRPPGQDLGEVGHVRLGIAAVDAQRVKFENLTREILVVGTVLLGILLGIGGSGSNRHLVFEITDHRGVGADGLQQVRELAESALADDTALQMACGGHHQVALAAVDRKVVGPELHEPLGEAHLRFERLGVAGRGLRFDDVGWLGKETGL